MGRKKGGKNRSTIIAERLISDGMEPSLARERAREMAKNEKKLHLKDTSVPKTKKPRKPREKKEKLTGTVKEKVEKFSDEIPQFVRGFNPTTQAAWLKSQKSKSRKFAIRAMCLMCVGGSSTDVRDCTDKNCPLYQFRITG